MFTETREKIAEKKTFKNNYSTHNVKATTRAHILLMDVHIASGKITEKIVWHVRPRMKKHQHQHSKHNGI